MSGENRKLLAIFRIAITIQFILGVVLIVATIRFILRTEVEPLLRTEYCMGTLSGECCS